MLSRIDREALERALKIDGRKLKRGDDWEDVATSAAYSCQIDSLKLKPWQDLPMFASDDKPRDEHPSAGRVAAWALRRRLIKAGLSVYEPNPIRALEAVAAGQRAEAAPFGRPTAVH
jgi:hypothetical protein